MSYTRTLTEEVAREDDVRERVGRLTLKLNSGGESGRPGPKYPQYMPVWEKSHFPDWEEVPYVDAATRGTSDKRHLFGPGSTREEITPAIGEEITGVQLSTLTPQGLDDLALLAAERGLLVFRDQDFKDIGPEKQLDIVRHFGRLHIHPTMGHPKGYPEMHVVYRDPDDNTNARYTKPNEVGKVTSVNWHQDHTAEIQPPGVTFFFGLEMPKSGGDTLFVSTTEAYEKFSDEFKTRLDGLQLVHDNSEMLHHAKSLDAPCRFSPQRRVHPLVRTHPATGKKYLFISPLAGHSGRVFGYKKEESDYLLHFLQDTLLRGGDFQARARYRPGTVVIWDNRVVAHSATFDFRGDDRRHVVRIAAMSDVPSQT